MEQSWLNRIKDIVRSFDPLAEILLYGSRARLKECSDSDWDLLILLNSTFSEQQKREMRHQLYEVEWDTGEVLSCIIHSRDEWEKPPLAGTPFHRNVAREGVRL